MGLLAAMATSSTDNGPGGLVPGCNTTAQQNSENADDGNHFLGEAKGNSFTPVFQTTAQSLATGSKLVQ